MDIYLCFIIGEGTKRVIDFRVGGVHLVLIAVAPNFILVAELPQREYPGEWQKPQAVPVVA